MGIMDDELDMDTAQTKEDKENATRAKASKTWRVLRLSAKSKLAAFDKIEDGKNLKLLFEAPQPSEGTPQVLEGTPQAHETMTKASTEGESGGSGHDHGSNSSEQGNVTVATEKGSADSKDAAAAAATTTDT